MAYTTHMTCALRISASRCGRSFGAPSSRVTPDDVAKWAKVYALPVSTMYVVTFSGVTSGGMVTSGTTC